MQLSDIDLDHLSCEETSQNKLRVFWEKKKKSASWLHGEGNHIEIVSFSCLSPRLGAQ